MKNTSGLLSVIYTVSMLFVSLPSQATASTIDPLLCKDALILDNFRSHSEASKNWALSTYVSESAYNEAKRDVSGNTVIQGIPMGGSYSEYQKNAKSNVSQLSESYNETTASNVLWSGLGANSAGTYTTCINALVTARGGLTLIVKSTSKTDMVLEARWTPNSPGAGISIPIVWKGLDGPGSITRETLRAGPLPKTISLPSEERSITVSTPGDYAIVVVKPIPPPPPPIQRPCGGIGNARGKYTIAGDDSGNGGFSVYVPECGEFTIHARLQTDDSGNTNVWRDLRITKKLEVSPPQQDANSLFYRVIVDDQHGVPAPLGYYLRNEPVPPFALPSLSDWATIKAQILQHNAE